MTLTEETAKELSDKLDTIIRLITPKAKRECKTPRQVRKSEKFAKLNKMIIPAGK